MDRNVRRVVVVAVIALVAGFGGVALGDFAMSGGTSEPLTRSGAEELMEQATNAASPVSRPADDLAPGNYVCHGCDARISNEPELTDDFAPFDPSPLPAYRPEPEERRRADDLPVIEADRTAPDALRRRAAQPAPPAIKPPRVPVLAADGATGSAETDQ
jgi:hypothetical protein